jgi:hypothetical protein
VNNENRLLDYLMIGNGLNSFLRHLTVMYAPSNVYENTITPQTVPMTEHMTILRNNMNYPFTRVTKTAR